MYPFLDTGDLDAELSTRSLDSDGLAYSSFFYPEGSAASGAAALQDGDRIPDEPWPGPNGLAPAIALDGIPGAANDAPILGRSLVSLDDGVSFVPETRFNLMFSLLLSADP
jgi:hypothetical protein